MGSSFRKPGLADTLVGGLKTVMKLPGAEAAATGVAGAVLLRALAGAGLNLASRRTPEGLDPNYVSRVKNAATLLGALGVMNPYIRAHGFRLPWSNDVPHTGSADALDFTPFLGTIDIGTASRTIHQDAFLHPYEKKSVLDVVRNAPQVTPGQTSQYNLFKSATRAGVSFIPAYSFGMLAGKALGMPEDTVRNLSRIGALAYAVRASGLTETLS